MKEIFCFVFVEFLTNYLTTKSQNYLHSTKVVEVHHITPLATLMFSYGHPFLQQELHNIH